MNGIDQVRLAYVCAEPVGALRERLQRKAHSAVIRARTCSGKRDGESSSRHAPITTMLHRVHHFRVVRVSMK
jgi:hypothetical protein